MDPRFFLPCFHGPRASCLGHKSKEKTRSITCPTDRAKEANKYLLLTECEVRTATYEPGIDQSQHVKSVSHIIRGMYCIVLCCIDVTIGVTRASHVG